MNKNAYVPKQCWRAMRATQPEVGGNLRGAFGVLTRCEHRDKDIVIGDPPSLFVFVQDGGGRVDVEVKVEQHQAEDILALTDFDGGRFVFKLLREIPVGEGAEKLSIVVAGAGFRPGAG